MNLKKWGMSMDRLKTIDNEIECVRKMPLRNKCDKDFRDGVIHGLLKARFIITGEIKGIGGDE
jgi:hypothetical protein